MLQIGIFPISKKKKLHNQIDKNLCSKSNELLNKVRANKVSKEENKAGAM